MAKILVISEFQPGELVRTPVETEIERILAAEGHAYDFARYPGQYNALEPEYQLKGLIPGANPEGILLLSAETVPETWRGKVYEAARGNYSGGILIADYTTDGAPITPRADDRVLNLAEHFQDLVPTGTLESALPQELNQILHVTP